MDSYELTIKAESNIFCNLDTVHKAWLKTKKCDGKWVEGWDYWVENSEGKKEKVTRGRKFLVGDTLKDAIANLEAGSQNVTRKVIGVTKL